MLKSVLRAGKVSFGAVAPPARGDYIARAQKRRADKSETMQNSKRALNFGRNLRCPTTRRSSSRPRFLSKAASRISTGNRESGSKLDAAGWSAAFAAVGRRQGK